MIFVFGIALILLAGNIILNRVIQNVVRKHLAQLSPVAKVNFSSINANILASSLSIKNLSIQFRPDSTDTVHQHLFNFPSVEFIGFHFLSTLFNQNLTINTVKLEQGDITLDRYLLDKKDSLNYDFAQLMQFTDLAIGHVNIAETKVWLHGEGESKPLLKGEIDIGDVNYNNRDSSLSKNQFHFGSIKCAIRDLDYFIPEAHRTLQLKQLRIDSREGLLQIDSCKITTQYTRLQLGRKLGHQADYVEATIPLVKISRLDFMQLLEKKLIADEVMINNIRIYVFRDRRLPRQSIEQPMPNGYLKEIPLEVRVNRLKINNASVISEEFPKTGDQSGTLKIGKINISMSPVLSRPLKNDPVYSETNVEGSIMNAGALKASIRAPIKREHLRRKGYDNKFRSSRTESFF